MAQKKTAPAVDTLLVELLTEELPPKALKGLSETFAQALLSNLKQRGLLEEDSKAHAFATPRRLAASITNVLTQGLDKPVESTGPSVKVGLDAEGKPTQALLGFARKQGVEVSQLGRQSTSKGDVFVYRTLARGGYLDTGLESDVQDAVRRLPIPKIMRWADGDAEFVRPVHGLVMMHGKRTVAGSVLGITSSNVTAGHRFMGLSSIRLNDADAYESLLRKNNVIADFAARRAEIDEQLQAAAKRQGASLGDYEELLDEVTALVELPAVYVCGFDRSFLDIPQECLILTMRQHQKYFPLFARDGKLLPKFLVVSNMRVKDPRAIVSGNERVVRPRLDDARFFFDQDRKVRLEERVPQLANVVFHNKLGSQLERVERIQLLAGQITRDLGADAALSERAAWLSKADLLTGMVGEFPELQGIMGRYYAQHDGEPAQVADAVEQHYRPRFAGDLLPENPVAVAVALADKLYSLAGLFGVGQQPTGEKDPYALRRAALGVVRLLVEKKLALPLDKLVGASFGTFPKQAGLGDAHTDLQMFVLERLRGYLRDAGYSANEVESVLSMNPTRLDQVPSQLAAVRAFMDLPEAASLASANKRVANILRQAASKGESFGSADRNALTEKAEIALLDSLNSASSKADALFQRGDYAGYLKAFSVLKPAVDAFFDSVMVMVEQESLRRNRLALLADLREKMNRVADISKLAVEK
ncbi:MAG TPA: glycine--tRNA ligase subunit beta [Burkholderiales bacterium]|nr:glycine--tRNA ligase subunit beta [Burkholderiales bacterium]